jgi:hypothetical protein
MFCALGVIFDSTYGVGSRFHVLPSYNHFRWNRGRLVLFACFALPNSFSAVPRAPCPVFVFSTPGVIFDGTEGVGSCFHVLRCRSHFRRYRGRCVPFSCFALPDSFSTMPRVSGPIFTFCAPGLILGGIEGAGSRFHVLCSQTHFRRNRGRRVPFECFLLSNQF